MYCSIHQAVEIWDDLRDAMEGKASHGYDAEIYAYRLLPHNPSMTMGKEWRLEDIIRASRSLVEIIDMFRERYTDTTVLIDGLEYNSWLEKYGSTFDHRVKVQFVQ